MIIYIDVLFLINLYVTYFQLLSVCIFTHTYISKIRIILSSVAGGAFSLVIFLPDDNALIGVIVKILSCVILSLSAFGLRNLNTFLKNTFFLLLVNFIFAGLMLCLWLFIAPLGMFYSNGALYFDIDGLTIIISTAVAYFVIRIVRFIFDKNGRADKKYEIEIYNNGFVARLSALPDTANGLVDYFSGMPVVICKKEKCMSVLPDAIKDINDFCIEKIKGVRLLPVSTVAGDSIVYAFKVDKITVISENRQYRVNALIGVMEKSRQEYDAIFNPKLLI